MLLKEVITTDHAPYTLGVIERFETQASIQETFAIDDTILHQMNAGKFPFPVALHFWPTEPVVFLGMQDTRIPHFKAGVDVLKRAGYTPVIRPAGGLAVVGDPEVINFTLLFHATAKKPDIFQAYQVVVTLLNALVKPYGEAFSAGEVKTSYCPGKYDLSLHGKKIAGLAQRRVGNAIGLYVYLSIAGDQYHRGALIRDFYRQGIQGEPTKLNYPNVDPDSMANLSATIPNFATTRQFIDQLLATYQAIEGSKIEHFSLSDAALARHIEAMARRNERLHD
ncbi:MAG: lipoate--protein ligase [Aerococcus sp.]|nr:lipoate--protein ligase [Aerococcus sp.]